MGLGGGMVGDGGEGLGEGVQDCEGMEGNHSVSIGERAKCS